MGYEVLSAFFLEAGFLGVMLFGMNRVGKGLHFTATLMVAIGTLFSAFWILSVNSWMQTPVGYGINEAGQFVPEDWWAIVFNPSFPYRLVHMVARRLSDHRLRRRCGRRLASPARARQSDGAVDVLDGDVDGLHRCPAPDDRRPRTRAEHHGIPARQDRRYGGAFRDQGRRTLHHRRYSRHGSGRNTLRASRSRSSAVFCSAATGMPGWKA